MAIPAMSRQKHGDSLNIGTWVIMTMETRHHILFKLLEAEFSKTLVPGTSNDMARQIATVSGRLLSRILAEQTTLPAMETEAISSVRTLLPQLRGQIDVDLYQAIEQGLADKANVSWDDIQILLEKAVRALIGRNDAASNKLAGQLIAIDSRLRAQHEAACNARCEVKPASDEGWDLSKFTEQQQAAVLDFLKQRFPAETRLTISGARPMAGGFGKQTVFISLDNNDLLPSTLVLRRDSPYAQAGASVTEEYPIIERMYAAGVPVAKPYALEDTGKVLGTKFMLTAAIEGRNLGDAITVERNPAVAIDLARVLARLHSVPITGLETTLAGGTISVRERMLAELDQREGFLKGLKHYHSYTVQAALDWLKLNVHLADAPKVIIHRDIGMHNALVHNDRISAILDWESAAIGAPADDLGWLYYTVCQLGDWETFLDVYQKEAGITLDRRQLDYYILWKTLYIAIVVARLGDAVVSGHINNIQLMYIGDHLRESLINRAAAKFAEILASS